ncbi:hypothetical protein IMG5_152750 [Ichthyophthirius multifiliis]|uniref:Right handed beta helix domain-containing protein n=1 Tax=Ichthyophthirius multifiliis TaxID=5932 RepID=G0QYW2_ICHMU|nr:hypothetical protein IMG5_152750 [Ichthyophthirius multifiliis]EGR29591.1 hypothetical protein IMG5_152750 [Ichthyophthirius multifiliis]|eukprot:XP_004030827.1 hypothetical protein IMG5_152750 [Ichthyophthirius multifiliis]
MNIKNSIKFASTHLIDEIKAKKQKKNLVHKQFIQLVKQNQVFINLYRFQKNKTDPEQGPYKTIQEAINEAQIGSIIKISPGLYSDNIYINKPNLIIESKEKVGDIIIIIENKPAIIVDLAPNQSCSISNIKFNHNASNQEDIQNDNYFISKINNYKDIMKSNQYEYQPQNEIPYVFPLNKQMNTILYLQGGIAKIQNCVFSLSYIQNELIQPIPAIVVQEQGNLYLNNVEIKGNKTQETIGFYYFYFYLKKNIGILINKGNAFIKQCKIHEHQLGGIQILSEKQNFININQSKINKNNKVGINCVGESGDVLIERCKIQNNNGPGIKVGLANKSIIQFNKIKSNLIGIEVISGEPLINQNEIERNYTDGILTICYNSIRCDALIKNNKCIKDNKENGIHCKGRNNYTRIENNKEIQSNKKAGIKADEEASISIFQNNILANKQQGILLVESSSSYIINNEISNNKKANIALGGFNSVNTYIINNIIKKGEREGIFIVEGSDTWIMRNQIYENFDGIICLSSFCELIENSIFENKYNGIMLIKESKCLIKKNDIHDNGGVGLYFKDRSYGKIFKNKINKNTIQIVIEKKNKNLQRITLDNVVSGDVRIPQMFSCNLY